MSRKNYSEITFGELAKDLCFSKVIWNGKVVFDDDEIAADPKVSLKKLYERYSHRYVYDMRIHIVAGHHCELEVEGEKQTHERVRVFGPLKNTKQVVYEQQLVDAKDVLSEAIIPWGDDGEDLFEWFLKLEPVDSHQQYQLCEIKLNNPENGTNSCKYGWLSSCSRFYIFKKVEA